jgi:hypothetical protein
MEIAASALMIFLDIDSILLTILLMVGGSWKITRPKITFGVVPTFRFSWITLGRSLIVDWQVGEKAELYLLGQPMGG